MRPVYNVPKYKTKQCNLNDSILVSVYHKNILYTLAFYQLRLYYTLDCRLKKITTDEHCTQCTTSEEIFAIFNALKVLAEASIYTVNAELNVHYL